MDQIDFEQIRLDAVQKATEDLGQDSYSKAHRMAAEMASQVTKNMLIAYHKSCKQPQDE